MAEEWVVQELIAQGLLDPEQQQKAQAEADKKKIPIEQAIADLKLVPKEDLYTLIADNKGVIYVDLDNYMPDPKLKELIPQDLCRRYTFMPLFQLGDILTISTTDPMNIVMLDRISEASGAQVECVYSSETEILTAIDKFYGKKDMTQELLASFGKVSLEKSEDGVLGEIGAESPISKLVDLIVTQAARDRASDIHIEPEEELLRIRFRIDGVLHEIPSPPKHLELSIISRVKVLGGMDIAESRAPQDGHFSVRVDERDIDLRVSTFPTVHGENVVMRLLDTGGVLVGLEKMGLGVETLKIYESLILRPYGIILSTGPTGSGKTTTLYSALTRINSIDRNIITIEDPVEYRLGLIRQTQVNPKAGITFANGLRYILRQDPDVIMVGEIRDLETAVIAIQAALTGHLVFSTLHTNDAPSTITRLINMGVEPFLISASLAGIMAQRLIRVICPDCKEAYEPSKALLDRLGLSNKPKVKFYQGKGCSSCKGTGYRGRTGVYELMTIDDDLREMIITNASTVQLRDMARKKGMKILSEDGLDKVLKGQTTWEEVSRVTEDKVDVKPVAAPEKLEKVVHIPEEEQAAAAPPKVAKAPPPKQAQADIAEYEKKIASWLSKK